MRANVRCLAVVVFISVASIFPNAYAEDATPKNILELEKAVTDAQKVSDDAVKALQDAKAEKGIKDVTPLEKAVSDAMDVAIKKKAGEEFLGVNWGMSIGITLGGANDKRVDEAMIDPRGYVRVTKGTTSFPRIMLETHYFLDVEKSKKIGWGPFVAVQPGSTKAIDAAGIGLMLGLRREDSRSSFNVGLGWIIDNGVKTLASGFQENEYSPDCRGDNDALIKDCTGQIRYQETTFGNWLLMTSFSF